MQSNSALTRRVLEGFKGPERSLLELLATDTIYSFKDDFDYGLDERIWTTRGSNLGGLAFVDADNINGWVSGDPGKADNAYSCLYSKGTNWSQRRRCTVMARFYVANQTSLKFEFGFSSFGTSPDTEDFTGCVLVKDTPTSQTGAGSYGVVVLDTDDDASIDLVAMTNSSTAKGVRSGGTTVGKEFTLMVAFNEHGGARSWVDGQPAGFVELQPASSNAGGGTMDHLLPTGPSDIRYNRESNMGIWVMAQNRAANIPNHALSIDFIQAWQERQPIA